MMTDEMIFRWASC